MVGRADQHLKTFLSILESTPGKITPPKTASCTSSGITLPLAAHRGRCAVVLPQGKCNAVDMWVRGAFSNVFWLQLVPLKWRYFIPGERRDGAQSHPAGSTGEAVSRSPVPCGSMRGI